MSRWGGRFAPNQENELRRLVKEPVQTWKREWVQPDPNKPFKVLKYVKTGQSIDFASQAALDAERAAGGGGAEPEEAEAEEPVHEVEADDDPEQDHDDEDDEDEGEPAAAAVTGVGTGGGVAPASALPAHMLAEAAAASASSSAAPSSSAQLEAAIVNVAAGIPGASAAALAAPALTADATGSEVVGGGGVQVASELNPAPDGAGVPVVVTPLDDAIDTDGRESGGGDAAAVPSRQEVRVIAGVGTEVLVQAFTDRILVLVTQMGRVGCLIQATTSAPAHYVQSSVSGSRPLFGDGDEFDGEGLAGDVPVTAYVEGPTTESGVKLPNPLPNTALLSLFGAPPAGMETLFSLYVSQIAALVFTRTGQAGGRAQREPDQRPVVVGLALRRLAEAGYEEGVLDAGERARFLEVMDMVVACEVW